MDRNLIKIAICYDFDGTLAPGNMQEYGFIQTLNMTPAEFWEKSDALAQMHSADKNLAYMLTMLREAEKRNIIVSRDYLRKIGKNVTYFAGVDTWFARLNAYAEKQGLHLQHFLISSGLKGIINGLSIANEFTKVYASSFMFDKNGIAFWPAQAVNYTNKTQYLFRISKGCLDETDISVNYKTPSQYRDIAFDKMMYIGDGLTDIPCMAVLRKFGGHAIAVYADESGTDNASHLLKDGRVDNIALADYSEGGRLEGLIKAWIDKIKSDIDLKA